MRATAFTLAIAGLAAFGAGAEAADPAKPASIELTQKYIDASWKGTTDDWRARLVQDETQKICTMTDNAPANDAAAAILAREKARIVYPADGKLMGDWKKGQALAQNGYGGRFTDTDPKRENGGNCYACHQLTKAELSYGTIGPSLYNFAKIRGYGEQIQRYAWGKVWNSQAFTACSSMPRFGHAGILTEEQVRHVVALLMSPESPVNH